MYIHTYYLKYKLKCPNVILLVSTYLVLVYCKKEYNGYFSPRHITSN